MCAFLHGHFSLTDLPSACVPMSGLFLQFLGSLWRALGTGLVPGPSYRGVGLSFPPLRVFFVPCFCGFGTWGLVVLLPPSGSLHPWMVIGCAVVRLLFLSSSPLVGCLSYPFSRLLFGPLSESPPEGFSVGLPCLFGHLRLALLPTVPFGTSSLYLCSRFLRGGVRLPFDSSTRLYFHPSVGVTTFGGVVRLLCQFRAQTVLLVLFCYSILSLLFFLSSFRPRGFG